MKNGGAVIFAPRAKQGIVPIGPKTNKPEQLCLGMHNKQIF